MQEIYPATKAVIKRDGKILMPGGGIKFGEDPEESLKREIEEEAGIEADIVRPLRVWTFFKNSGKTQVVGVTFMCKCKSGEVKLSAEHTDFKWIMPEGI